MCKPDFTILLQSIFSRFLKTPYLTRRIWGKMGVPNKQIGWSQESNLLFQISKQLDQLIKVTGALANALTTTTTTTATP